MIQLFSSRSNLHFGNPAQKAWPNNHQEEYYDLKSKEIDPYFSPHTIQLFLKHKEIMIHIKPRVILSWTYSISKITTPYNDGTGLTSSTWHDNVMWPNIFSQKSYVTSSPNHDIWLILRGSHWILTQPHLSISKLFSSASCSLMMYPYGIWSPLRILSPHRITFMSTSIGIWPGYPGRVSQRSTSLSF